MLNVYGPDCDGSEVPPGGRIPPGATWMDLDRPTPEEEKLVEALVGHNVPTQQELAEIEPSSRLFERDGALYMTLSALHGVTEGAPTSTPIGFVIVDNRLVTVRYASPSPIVAFAKHVRREPEIARNAMSVLVRMLDAIIDRLADELESSGSEIERISGHIFNKEPDARRIPAARLTALLTRIGRAQSLLAEIRETAVSTSRLLSFRGANFPSTSKESAGQANVASLMNDITSLIDHSGFLADNLTFLLDAALGLISVEQNAAMKLFTWSALIFLPPTLIAGIYGMNFRHMPELNWLYGYPMAISLIIASAVLPMWFLKRRGWI